MSVFAKQIFIVDETELSPSKIVKEWELNKKKDKLEKTLWILSKVSLYNKKISKYLVSKGIDCRSVAFIKMIELLIIIDPVLPKNKFRSFHNCEYPGSFIKAIQYFYSNYKKVTWIANSLEISNCTDMFGLKKDNPDNWLDIEPDVLEEKAYGQYEDYFSNKENKVDLYTADGSMNIGDKYNEQEKLNYGIIAGELKIGLISLNLKGTMIIKFFSMFMKKTIDLIIEYGKHFRKVLFTKPVSSNSLNSEIYVIFVDRQEIPRKINSSNIINMKNRANYMQCLYLNRFMTVIRCKRYINQEMGFKTRILPLLYFISNLNSDLLKSVLFNSLPKMTVKKLTTELNKIIKALGSKKTVNGDVIRDILGLIGNVIKDIKLISEDVKENSTFAAVSADVQKKQKNVARNTSAKGKAPSKGKAPAKSKGKAGGVMIKKIIVEKINDKDNKINQAILMSAVHYRGLIDILKDVDPAMKKPALVDSIKGKTFNCVGNDISVILPVKTTISDFIAIGKLINKYWGDSLDVDGYNKDFLKDIIAINWAKASSVIAHFKKYDKTTKLDFIGLINEMYAKLMKQ